jgi:hypothetical protein
LRFWLESFAEKLRFDAITKLPLFTNREIGFNTLRQ